MRQETNEVGDPSLIPEDFIQNLTPELARSARALNDALASILRRHRDWVTNGVHPVAPHPEGTLDLSPQEIRFHDAFEALFKSDFLTRWSEYLAFAEPSGVQEIDEIYKSTIPLSEYILSEFTRSLEAAETDPESSCPACFFIRNPQECAYFLARAHAGAGERGDHREYNDLKSAFEGLEVFSGKVADVYTQWTRYSARDREWVSAFKRHFEGQILTEDPISSLLLFWPDPDAGPTVTSDFRARTVSEFDGEEVHWSLSVVHPTLAEDTPYIVVSWSDDFSGVLPSPRGMIPLAENFLPDLRIFDTPPRGWGSLSPSSTQIKTDSPSRFPDGYLSVVNCGHYFALRESLYRGLFGKTEDSPWPTAPLDKGDSRGYAQMRPVILDEQPFIPEADEKALSEMMFAQVANLSDLDADVLDALCTLWLLQADSPTSAAVADINDLFRMRGIKPKISGQNRRGGYMPDQKREILGSLTRIESLWLTMTQVTSYERGRKHKNQDVIESRAFVITDKKGQLRLDGYLDVRRFIFRLGAVFGYYVFTMGRQTALLSAKALQYNPHKEVWEKRLTRYLSWQWRNRARKGKFLHPFTVRTLLTAIGKGFDEEGNFVARRGWETKERLEKALNRVEEDGVIATWQYQRWEELDRTDYQAWLDWTVVIEPPDEVKDYYELSDKAAPAPKPDLPEKGSAALKDRIKSHRKGQRLTQLQAAEQLGISQPYYSQIERGKVDPKTLSGEVRKAVTAWLNGQALHQ